MDGGLRLQGKVAIVTGAGKGIGAAVAQRFTLEGARVAILDRDLESAEKTCAPLKDARAYECDVASSVVVDEIFDSVAAHFGAVHILAHVAGVSPSHEHWEHVSRRNNVRAKEVSETGHAETPIDATTATSDEEWARVMRVNLDGTFFCVRSALRLMTPQRSGSIITTASNSAVTGWPGIAHYAASKGGVLSFTRSVAREVIEQGIRVNCVAPGGVDTPMMRDKPAGFNPGAVSLPPIARVASAEEIAAVFAFLASDDASYLVGETINANGGVHTV
jgi:NAD(P)-dependent dehydrogenase (short-subunit alcohol dehydrogenase family)